MRRVGHAFEIDRPLRAAVRAPRRLGEARRDTPRPSGVLAAPLPESGPGGPPARPEAAPPAPRAGHWTRDEQIGSLIRVADRQPDVGFMVRLLALCTLPRTDPGTLTHYVRRNDRYALVVIAGGPEQRLPYGIPSSVSSRQLSASWIPGVAKTLSFSRTASSVCAPGPALR